jgi:hypothetical protein
LEYLKTGNTTEEKENKSRKAPVIRAPPAALPNLHPGRYPGLQVLIYRLPMMNHSGLKANPHLLTVAGAA